MIFFFGYFDVLHIILIEAENKKKCWKWVSKTNNV